MLCIQPHLNDVFDRLAAGALEPIFVMGTHTPDREAETVELQTIFPNRVTVRESRAFVGTMRELEGNASVSNQLYILVGTHGLATESFLQMRLEEYKRGSVVLIPDSVDTIVTNETSLLRKFQNMSGEKLDGRILPITMSEVAGLLSGVAQKGPKPNLPASFYRTSGTQAASGDRPAPAL